MALGHWGAGWIGSRLQPGQLDAGFLMWDVRRFVRLDGVPADRRVVIHFHFPDAGARERDWWLVVEDGRRRPVPRRPGPRPDPGGRVDRPRAHRGVDRRPAPDAVLRSHEVRVVGATRDAERFWEWLGTSVFAPSRHLRVAG